MISLTEFWRANRHALTSVKQFWVENTGRGSQRPSAVISKAQTLGGEVKQGLCLAIENVGQVKNVCSYAQMTFTYCNKVASILSISNQF